MQITLDTISQVGLTILSVTAIILISKKNKWGFVVGLCSQPFWFITSLINEQWGIFVTSIIFTFSWIFGIYQWFFKKKNQKEIPDRHHY